MAVRSVNSVEEIHEISSKLEAANQHKKSTPARIQVLEEEIKTLKESHHALAKHYHEFVKATIQTIKEISEE